MRFAILTAVSTKKQADPNLPSLDEQENKSRALGLSKPGWKETAGPFRIPGASRSFYVNLSDAEEDIPQLAEMLNAAQAKKFDVLIFYSYDRLGDIADLIAQALRFYGVQLLSVSQGTEVQRPESFDPYVSDAETNMRTVSKMIQQFRIADLRRKFRSGMEKRVSLGLNSLRIPYGYARPEGREWDKKAVPVQVPAQAKVVAEIASLFLHGTGYYEISRILDRKGYPSPEGAIWNHQAIKVVLRNPFYAGKVFFGLRKVARDVRAKTKYPRLVANPNPMMNDGKHEPIYSWETYQAIMAEMARRESLPRNARFPFSGLLRCSLCDKALHHDRQFWRCNHHVSISNVEALALIPPILQKKLRTADPSNAELAPAPKNDPEAQLQELGRQRRKVQQGFESDLYTAEEAEKKIKAIEAKIKALKDSDESIVRDKARHQTFLDTLEGARQILEDLPRWIRNDDPREVNSYLLRLFRRVVITPDLKISAELHQ